jgi:hypothetical protein
MALTSEQSFTQGRELYQNLVAARKQKKSPTASTDPYAAYQTAMDKANKANEARYQEMLGKYKNIENIYSPTGTFGQGQLAQIETQKQRDIASGMQGLVSSGMANTTVATGLPSAWEANVGSQARLNLADLQNQRYAEALGGTAGAIERRTDVQPDLGQYANLVQAANMSYNPTQPVAQTTQPSYQPTISPVATPQPSVPTPVFQPQPMPTGNTGQTQGRKEGDTWTQKGPSGQETQYQIKNGQTYYRFKSPNTGGWTNWEPQGQISFDV